MTISNSTVTASRQAAVKKTKSGQSQQLPLWLKLGRFFKLHRRGSTFYGVVAFNTALLITLSLFIIGSLSIEITSGSSGKNNSIQPLASDPDEVVNPLDSLSSAEVAVHAARAANIHQATSVTNQADSLSAQRAVNSVDDKVISKPQVISPDPRSKHDIETYVAKKGDTIGSVAKKFEISRDTVRLSNNLTSEKIRRGTKLKVSPINGIVYKVKSGDTPASLAARYQSDKQALIAFNDAEISGFQPGELIVVPNGIEPAAATSSNYGRGSFSSGSYSFSYGSGPVYGGNGYTYGYCTYWAALRRAQIGRPIPSNLGNAATWVSLAAAAGLPIGDQPRAGAVLWHRNTSIAGGLGHVGFVERVNPNGSALISEMNNPIWGRATHRTISPSEFGQYRFIY